MSGFRMTMSPVRLLVLGAGALLLGSFVVSSIWFRDNDFYWHVLFGQRFLQGDPYSFPSEWYLVGRGMLNVPSALLPYRVSRAVFCVLALGCLLGTLRMLARMTDNSPTFAKGRAFDASALALLVIMPWLTRDIQECGLQIFLLTMLVGGTYALWAGRSLAAGFWFALAATWKTTPLLCLPVLLLKRQWSAALALVVFFVVLNGVLPATWLGREKTLECLGKTVALFQRTGKLQNIADNGIEEAKPKNQALIAVFARYLQTYPPGHDLYIDHPAFVQFGSFDPATARITAKTCLLLLGAWVAWNLRRSQPIGVTDTAWQWAGVYCFCALVSPMCWRQHLVLALPAVWLLIRSTLADVGNRRLQALGLILVGLLVWLPQRELFGAAITQVLMTYKIDSFVVLGVALVVLSRKSDDRQMEASIGSEQPLRMAA